jgi:tight adherence protein B
MVFIAIAIFAGPLYGIICGGIVAMIPAAFIARRQQGRLRAFEEQLPDTLTLLAGTLRAGFSFMQGLESVAQEISDPMRRELQRVFTEVRLGRAPEDALSDTAARMQSSDLGWTVMAIKIQREVGGNLATLLDTVAETMQQRERLRREARALTAEGRISAVILGLAAPILGFVMYLGNRNYLHPLFHDGIGIASLVGGAVLAILGFFWLRRIIDIEV